MTRRLIIDFLPRVTDDTAIHRIRNFGEALFVMFREDGWAEVSLAEVDRATNRLVVTVRSARRVRRIAANIEGLLVEHHLDAIARLTQEKLPP